MSRIPVRPEAFLRISPQKNAVRAPRGRPGRAPAQSLGDCTVAVEPAPTDSSLALDRRQGERYPCHPDVTGQLALAKQGRVPVRRICNVSSRGVGLVVSRRVETRTVVALSFQDLARGV